MAPTSNPTLLIVDDEEGIHRALQRTLRREPFELVHAYDTGEAEAILQQRPDVRAIICDHYMPGVPGLDFLIHVRKAWPGIATVLLTAQADLGMVITAMNEGQIHRFFTKPWDASELRVTLRGLVGLPAVDASSPSEREAARQAALRRSMAPLQDGEGAWVISPPKAGGSEST